MKIGFITKFPVDFYDTMVDAAKAWNEDNPEVEMLFAQGESGTDDEGEIAAIESMVTQGVQAIVITPTSPNVQDALQAAVDEGIKVILVDNDIPDWDGKTSVVATDNLAGGVLAGEFMAGELEPGDTVAVLEGVPGAPSLDDRVTGFLDGLGDEFEVVASLPTDCDQTKGLDATQDILTANPDVTAIYGACGPPVIGGMEAIASAGKTRQGRRLRRRPGRGRRHRRRRPARLGGAVPRQDGGDGLPGGSRRHQRRGRPREHRHRHRDRHRGQRQRVRRLTATWPPGRSISPAPGAAALHLPITSAGKERDDPHQCARRRRRPLPDLALVGRLGRDEPRTRLLRRLPPPAHR